MLDSKSNYSKMFVFLLMTLTCFQLIPIIFKSVFFVHLGLTLHSLPDKNIVKHVFHVWQENIGCHTLLLVYYATSSACRA